MTSKGFFFFGHEWPTKLEIRFYHKKKNGGAQKSNQYWVRVWPECFRPQRPRAKFRGTGIWLAHKHTERAQVGGEGEGEVGVAAAVAVAVAVAEWESNRCSTPATWQGNWRDVALTQSSFRSCGSMSSSIWSNTANGTGTNTYRLCLQQLTLCFVPTSKPLSLRPSTLFSTLLITSPPSSSSSSMYTLHFNYLIIITCALICKSAKFLFFF